MFRVLPTINFSCQMAFAQNIETLFTLYAHKLQPLAFIISICGTDAENKVYLHNLQLHITVSAPY